jgi:hypothetical protein
MPANESTETLTDDMILTLRDEAAAAGDVDLVRQCNAALDNSAEALASDIRPLSAAVRRDSARATCAEAITAARAMDDDVEFVRVVLR